LSETGELEENQRLLIHPQLAISLAETVVCNIPSSEVSTFVLQDTHLLKMRGPIIHVFLLVKPLWLNTVIAPLQTLWPPPAQASQSLFVRPKDEGVP